MKIFINIFAAILILLGILIISYKGFNLTTRAQFTDILPLNILSSETSVGSPFSRTIGWVSIVAGVALLAFNFIKRK